MTIDLDRAIKKIDFESWHRQIEGAFHTPSLVVAIYAAGKTWLGAAGMSNPQTQARCIGETIFPIASITKSMTAALIGRLVEEGTFDWLDPIKRHLPEFSLATDQLTYRLTIYDILANRSGLEANDWIWRDEAITRSMLATQLKEIEPIAPLGEVYTYNNILYGILGELIQRVIGMSWEAAMEAYIFKPLSIAPSYFHPSEFPPEGNIAIPTQYREGKYESIPFIGVRSVGPAGSVALPAKEVLKWMAFYLDETNALVSKETREKLVQPIIEMPSRGLIWPHDWKQSYGLGLWSGAFRSHRKLEHTGGIDGFRSIMTLLPDEKVGVFVASNSESKIAIHATLRHILDALLGYDDTDWLAVAGSLKAL